MPIQPLNVSSGNYNQIPDAEDVTPVDNSIAKKIKKSLKAIAVVVGCCLVIAALLSTAVWFTKSTYVEPVRIYQTAMDNGDRLKLLDASDLLTRGYPVDSIAFGNFKCTSTPGDPASVEVCSTTTSNPATVTIDSEQDFQKIIGFGGAFTESAAYNFYKLPPTAQQKVIKKDSDVIVVVSAELCMKRLFYS
jgi:hypothetical protein